jgi:hypothetical protein
VNNEEKTKVCTKCKREKNISEFAFQDKKRNIRMSWCKSCTYELKLKQYARKEEAGLLTRVGIITSRELKKQGLKRCPTCKMVKALKDDFFTSKNSNGGYASHCKDCSRILSKKLSDTPEQKEKSKKRYKKNKKKLRNTFLKRKFGITLEVYNKILKEQKGVCAVCGRKEKNKSLAVDHDHKTGKIRGLLCGRCNPALGFLQESPKLIKKILEYINKYK